MHTLRILSVLLLLFSLPTFADDFFLRHAFAQQYTDAEAKGIITSILTSEVDEPGLKQSTLVAMYSDIINSGKFNVLEAVRHFHNGYLNRVEITALPFAGRGNQLRLYIRVEMEGKSPSEKDFSRHRAVAKHMMEHYPNMVPIATVVGRDGKPFVPLSAFERPLVEEIFYLEPSWYNPKATLDSLSKSDVWRLNPLSSLFR